MPKAEWSRRLSKALAKRRKVANKKRPVVANKKRAPEQKGEE